MKIAILSDIHEGLNRKRTEVDLLDILDDWIQIHSPDVFIIGGDMTAKPDRALAHLNLLQKDCPGTKFLFVHGNHDIYGEDSVQAYETLLQFPGNLGNGPVQLENDWVIIGDGGWYDYSFGLPEYTHEQFEGGTFGDFTWPDKKFANWRETDVRWTNRYVERLENWLQENEDKKIIMVTHMVPFLRYVQCKNNPEWDFFNAMMGSKLFGELALKYGVRKYIFGHIHTKYHETYKGMEIICNPLGYFPGEWDYLSPEEEIFAAIKVIEV